MEDKAKDKAKMTSEENIKTQEEKSTSIAANVRRKRV
jgi:hypothetical protein